jgi:WD40 repeat protein
MARVFVSHASAESELAVDLGRWLVAHHHEVFLDQDLQHGLAVGDLWEQRLYERLRWADAVVCLLSSAYAASAWCMAEVIVARWQGSRLLPLRVEPDAVHPLLQTIQHADYATDPHTARCALDEALRRIDMVGGWSWPEGQSPFPGLQPFDTDQHRAFFGRRDEVDDLAGLLRSLAARMHRELVLVVGPSGCGKSSLVRAGLLPVMAAETDWLTLAPFFPGTEPSGALAVELVAAAGRGGLEWTLPSVRERLASGDGLGALARELLVADTGRRRRRHLLMVIDQLEELLTQASPDRSAEFADLLRMALAGPVQVVATIRSESLPDLLVNPLADLPIRLFMVPLLRHDALPAVIEGPARLAGIGVERQLVDRLVADTGTGEALPLLAFTLSELATGISRGDHLSIRRYEELGGVSGALQRQADAALETACSATGRHRHAVIAGLLRLVSVDERGNPTPWRARRRDLPEPVRVELDAFVARRLLTTDTDQSGHVLVGVAHEAFLSAWAPLAEAIAAAASAMRARLAVEQAAGEWDAHGRPARRLWEGNQLAAVQDATGARPRRPARSSRMLIGDHVDLSPRAHDFLRSSIRRDRGRRRRVTVVLSALLAAAVSAAGVAFAQQHEALRQQRIADSRQVAAESDALRSTDPVTSALLSVEAFRIAPTIEARSSLLSARSPSYDAIRAGQTGPVNAVAISPGGGLVAAADQGGAIELVELGRDVRPVILRPAGSALPMYGVALSPDGNTVAGARQDGSVEVWDVHSYLLGPAVTCGPLPANGVAFSPDGQIIAGACADGTVRMWDARTGFPDATLAGGAGPSPINDVAFSPDGHVVAGADADGTVLLWDTGTGRRVATLALPNSTGPVRAIAFSADGTTLAAGTDGGSVLLWDTSSRTVRRIVGGGGGAVRATVFGTNGSILAVSSEQGAVRLWDLTSNAPPVPLTGPTGEVLGLAFGPGNTLVSANANSTIGLWTLTVGPRDESAVDIAAYAPLGHVLATAGADHTIRLRGLPGRAPLPVAPPVPVASGDRFAMALSPEGRTLATPTAGGAIALRDVAAAVMEVMPGPPGGVSAVAFSPDGRFLAAGGGSAATGVSAVDLWTRTADRWDVSPKTVTHWVGGQFGAVHTVAFSPDGGTIAAGSAYGSIVLLKVPSVSPGSTLTGHLGPVQAVAFSSDGRTLASGGADGIVKLWDTSSHRLVASFGGHAKPVVSVAFSPEGTTLASASNDSTIRLWAVPTGTPVAVLTGQFDVTAVTFTDGHTLSGADRAAKPVFWITDVNRVLDEFCVGHPALTLSQWQLYVPPDLPYQPICL